MQIGRKHLVAALGAVTVVLAGAALAAQAAEAPATGATVQVPPAGGRFDYQIGGSVEYSPAPAVVSRDSRDQPWPGVYSICYLNAFQSQPGDTSLKSSWLMVGGAAVADPNWPGEYVLDTRGHRAALVAAFTTQMSNCAAKGFRAVEFDNLDSYDRSRGALTVDDNLAYARELIDAAHRQGLAAAQKNAVEIAGRAPFDFAVSESCLRYGECGGYTDAYRTVLDIEYVEEMNATTFQQRCAAAVAAGAAPSFVFRDLEVTAGGVRQWCNAQPATGGPVTSTSTAPTTAPTTPSTTTTSTTTKSTTTAPTTSSTRTTRTIASTTCRRSTPCRRPSQRG